MPVLLPPDGSALATRSAGRYGVQINIGTTLAPDWVFVNGLTSYEPKTDPNLEDDTDISSDGWASQAVTGNALTVSFEGLVKGAEAGGVFSPDPGLQALIEASVETDSGGHVHMRHWRTDGMAGAPWNLEFHAAVKASPAGGKTTELQKFSGDLTGRGKPVTIVAPTS